MIEAKSVSDHEYPFTGLGVFYGEVNAEIYDENQFGKKARIDPKKVLPEGYVRTGGGWGLVDETNPQDINKLSFGSYARFVKEPT